MSDTPALPEIVTPASAREILRRAMSEKRAARGLVDQLDPLRVTLDGAGPVYPSDVAEALELETDDRVWCAVDRAGYAVLDRLRDQGDPAVAAPGADDLYVGAIIEYYGDPADLPVNWQVCDGTNGTPNMTGRVSLAADGESGGSWNRGQTGGAVSHDHGPGSYSVPSAGSDHTHGSGGLSTGGPSSLGDKTGGSGDMPHPDHTHNISGTTGSDQHGHDGLAGNAGSSNGLPPYIAVYKVMRIA